MSTTTCVFFINVCGCQLSITPVSLHISQGELHNAIAEIGPSDSQDAQQCQTEHTNSPNNLTKVGHFHIVCHNSEYSCFLLTIDIYIYISK